MTQSDIRKLPLPALVDANSNDSSLDAASSEAINIFLNEAGGLCRRGGIRHIANLHLAVGETGSGVAGVTGCYWIADLSVLVAIFHGKFFAIDCNAYYNSGNIDTAVNLPGSIATMVPYTNEKLLTQVNSKISFTHVSLEHWHPLGRPSAISKAYPVFTACGDRCVIHVVYRDNVSGVLKVDDLVYYLDDIPGWPSKIDQVVVSDRGLFVNERGTKKVHYSDFAAISPTWVFEYGGVLQMDALYDEAITLAAFNQELLIFGRNSMEAWENDGVTPFSRRPGGVLSMGAHSRECAVTTRGDVFWISHNLVFMSYNFGQPVVIPCPFLKEIRTWSNFRQIYGSEFITKDFSGVWWRAPGASASYLMYAQGGQVFWTKLISVDFDGNETSWPIRSTVYAAGVSTTFAANETGGMLCVYDENYFVDDVCSTVGDLASKKHYPVVSRVVTGDVSHGVHNNKVSRVLRLRARAGENNQDDTEGVLRISWADNGSKTFSQGSNVTLGGDGDFVFTRALYRNGIYQTRKWKIECSDAVPLTITDLEEDIEVLEY